MDSPTIERIIGRAIREFYRAFQLTTTEPQAQRYYRYCYRLVELEYQLVWFWFNQNYNLTPRQTHDYQQLVIADIHQFRIRAQHDNHNITSPAFIRQYNFEITAANGEIQIYL